VKYVSKGRSLMASNLNITTIAEEIQNRLPALEYAVGKGNLQPFGNTNSGSRKIMQIIQKEQGMQLELTEPAIIMTGSENQFGEASSSFIRADANYVVVDKIQKYSGDARIGASNYWIILLDTKNGVLHTIERTDYRHITESYGYKFDNTYMDKLNIGETVMKGTPIKKSASFDSANNKCDGVNLTTVYMATALTTEDPILISESAANKFKAPLFSPVKPVVNDNDILLNLYGDNDNYKTFPDIGEEVKGGILCAVRRERKDDEALFSQSWERLKDIMISDERYTVKGKVIDINVYCNNPEKLQSSVYNKQIAKYYNMNIEFCNGVVNSVQPLLDTGVKMTYDMEKLFDTCKGVLDGKKYINEKVFNNINLEIVVMEVIPLRAGDKITDRYGGKGVVSKIVADSLMPHFKVNGRWEPVDAQYNSSTVVNRENPGQLLETSITFVGGQILHAISEGLNNCTMKLYEAEAMIYKYMKCLSETQAEYYKETINSMGEEDRIYFMRSMLCDGAIYMSIKPISESMSIDKLRILYKEFPWIEMSEILVPILDSNNNWRYVIARRKLVTGKKYIYRLKQFAEEKFSAVSLASTNIRSENTKSKMNKLHKTVHASTPVRFGEMELEDLLHAPVENIIQMIMLLSTSPLARRLHQELLTGNPFDIDIKLDKDSVSRSVEIVNAYLKTAGLRLRFDKIPKKKNNTALRTIATRVPGAIGVTDIADRIPKFIESVDSLKSLIAKNIEAIGKPLNIAVRVPSHIKTQQDADLYINDKELSENISAVIELVDANVTTKEELEHRIVNRSSTAKSLNAVNRWVVERHPDNFGSCGYKRK
jgi:hypothetical protein